ncbi:MAG: hypothetical protein LBG47_09080 [Prevotellaceae bacterium]|jgi:hypothetical protein|nr:hypothetical protein [Prevotellaceae bacterium]
MSASPRERSAGFGGFWRLPQSGAAKTFFLRAAQALYKAAKWPQNKLRAIFTSADGRTGKNAVNFSLFRSHRRGAISPKMGGDKKILKKNRNSLIGEKFLLDLQLKFITKPCELTK